MLSLATLIILSKSLLYGAVHCSTQKLVCETINIFFISINEKQSLKGIIQNAEYEIAKCFPKLFLHYSCSAPLLKILEKYFDRVYCFVKLHPLRQTELFQRRYKLYVKCIDVVSLLKRHHVSATWLIQTCNFTKK